MIKEMATEATSDLRVYQRDAIKAVHDGIAQGKQTGFITLPTSVGKTRIVAHLVRDFLPHGRILCIVHHEEIVRQIYDEIDTLLPGYVGIVQGNKNNIDYPIIVATIQSLRGKRLDMLINANDIPFAALFISEAHHSTAVSYRKLIQRLQQQNRNLIVVGETATAFRADYAVLQEVLPYCYYERTIYDMQQMGVLAPFVYHRVFVPMNLLDIVFRRKSGELDYDAEMLARDAMRPEVLRALVAGTVPAIGERLTLAFTVNVRHAELLAAEYQKHGIRAVALSGETPHAERLSIVERFRRGNIQIICNCQILTEGINIPEISCIVMACPTGSRVKYIQCVGRGNRKAPNKKDCLILDVTPGIPDQRQIRLNAIMPLPENEDDTDNEIDVKGHKRVPQLSMINSKSHKTWKWTYIENYKTFTAPIDRDHSIWLVRNPDKSGNGLYRIGVYSRISNQVFQVVEMSDEYPEHTAIELASKYLSVHATRKLAKRNQNWEELPATIVQLNFLKRFAQDVLLDVMEDTLTM